MIINFRDLVAWQKGIELAEKIYEISQKFPKEETYGLAAQIRRAAVSIPSNIAEGHGRSSDGDFVRFLSIAVGSLREVETQLVLSQRLHYITPEEVQPLFELCDEVGRLINGLKNKIKRG